jgi:hypothetical protein
LQNLLSVRQLAVASSDRKPLQRTRTLDLEEEEEEEEEEEASEPIPHHLDSALPTPARRAEECSEMLQNPPLVVSQPPLVLREVASLERPVLPQALVRSVRLPVVTLVASDLAAQIPLCCL